MSINSTEEKTEFSFSFEEVILTLMCKDKDHVAKTVGIKIKRHIELQGYS